MVTTGKSSEPIRDTTFTGQDRGQISSGGVDLGATQRTLGAEVAQLAWGLPGGLTPGGILGGFIQQQLNKDKGPHAQQAQMLDKVLTDGGRARGNTEGLPIGADDKGNQYMLKRTSTGVEISVKTGKGDSYTLEIAGGGAVKKATYVGADGADKPLTPATADKMLSTAIVLGQQATSAPDELGSPTGPASPSTKPAPEL